MNFLLFGNQRDNSCCLLQKLMDRLKRLITTYCYASPHYFSFSVNSQVPLILLNFTYPTVSTSSAKTLCLPPVPFDALIYLTANSYISVHAIHLITLPIRDLTTIVNACTLLQCQMGGRVHESEEYSA